ncbi:putative transmembrane protein 244 isoform X6 [Macaca fascicularis]|uniref:putative transmembrane protein 244 isoform X6 n=1 Tax=Macaca fascicularis TaxID=9541 RepID=UPI0007600A17|nr:transmembrane protein 244 isoform X6 [Macaca fascicularis]
MALQVRVAPSKVVLQKLLLCVILFYTVYYVSLSTGCMLFEVHELDVLAPFDFKTNPSWLNINYKGTSLAFTNTIHKRLKNIVPVKSQVWAMCVFWVEGEIEHSIVII